MLKFFDARCLLGRRAVVKPGSVQTREEILELMDRCHIEKALCWHIVSKEGEMQAGNELLLEEVKDCDRFLPQWCAMPSAFGEFMQPEQLLDAMKDAGVSTLRLLPKSCGYSLKPWSLGKLMDACAQAKVPVFLNVHEEIAPAEIYDLCTAYPEVNFVFGNPSYRENRYFGPIMDACDNFYLGIGNYVPHGGLKLFADHYGVEHLIFDTGVPYASAASAVSLVCYAELSEEQKQLIAHGNLERLLDGVKL